MSSRAGGGPIRRRSGGRGAKGGGKSSAPELHGPLHEMHRTIERETTNFEDLQKLLDKGEAFCRGDGLNCFILTVSKRTVRTADSTKRWDLLMKMLQVDSRGILARDDDGKSLLKYFHNDEDRMKQLIELGADLNNVDKNGHTLIQNLFSSDVFKGSLSLPVYWEEKYSTPLVQVWEMLLDHKEIQNQVAADGDFFQELVAQTSQSRLARRMFFKLIQSGILNIEELKANLKMHPLFFIIQFGCKESTELLHYIWKDDPDKKRNVSVLGEDLNILDSNGKSILECLFSSDGMQMIFYSCSYRGLALELWNLLIKHHEIQSQASKEGYFRSLAPLAKRSLTSDLVQDIFASIFQLGVWSVEKLTSELEMHPLVFLMELAEGRPSNFLRAIISYPSFFEDKTILFTKTMSEYYHHNDRLHKSWRKIQPLLNIPNVLTLDIFGYILFTLKLNCYLADIYDEEVEEYEGESNEMKLLTRCLTTLLKYGFVPCCAAGVVHPIHALMYNIFINSEKIILIRSRREGTIPEEKNLPNLLQKTMIFFKDFPVPHQLVEDPESGTLMLDVHMLISSMIRPAIVRESKANETLFQLIMTLLQLSPCHPLQNFTTFYKYSVNYFQKNRHKESLIKTFGKLLKLTVEASGSHKFQGVDQTTLKMVKKICKSVKVSQSCQEYNKEYGQIRKAAKKAERQVSSLQWMCILQIRKNLFQNRSSPTVTLPSLIRGLVSEGRLAPGLETDVLLYKPNKYINF